MDAWDEKGLPFSLSTTRFLISLTFLERCVVNRYSTVHTIKRSRPLAIKSRMCCGVCVLPFPPAAAVPSGVLFSFLLACGGVISTVTLSLPKGASVAAQPDGWMDGWIVALLLYFGA